MGTTPIRGIPYIEPGDALNAFPAADKAQAEKLEALLSPATSVVDAFTAATGWSVTAQSLVRVGPLAFWLLQGARTGADITVTSTTGAFSSVQAIAQLDAARFPVSYGWAFVPSVLGGRPLFGGTLGSGQVRAISTSPAGVYTTGTAYSISGLTVLSN